MHGKEPQFGPKGLHSSSTTGQYIDVDAAANSDFATTFPADYQSFIANTHRFSNKIPEAVADLSASPVQELFAVAPRSAKIVARQTVGRGEVGDSTQVSGGRACSRQVLLMSFVATLLGFVTTDHGSILLPYYYGCRRLLR